MGLKKKLVILYSFFMCSLLFYYITKTTETPSAGVAEGIEEVSLEGVRVPTIFLITPTYKRPTQKADLTRLYQTLLHIHNIHWIIIEDSFRQTALIRHFIARVTFPVTHLNVPTNVKKYLKGLCQRNAGIKWILTHVNPWTSPGVVYFADDDNTYDLRIFEEMRYTKKVSVWPVGFLGLALFARPIVENGKVVRWRAYYEPNRTFAVDMASFALNIDLLFRNRDPYFDPHAPKGHQEPLYLDKFVKKEDLEPKAENCTKVWVWHTRTVDPDLVGERKLQLDNWRKKVTEPFVEV